MSLMYLFQGNLMLYDLKVGWPAGLKPDLALGVMSVKGSYSQGLGFMVRLGLLK